MLRSSRKQHTLHLAPHGYAITTGRTGSLAWTPWPTPGRPFPECIAELAFDGTSERDPLDVVVDLDLARAQVVRIPAGLRSGEERQGFLKACFRKVFGAEASQWRCISEVAYANEPVPAIAIDESLMQAVAALAERHKLRLRSLRTTFVDSFNRMRKQMSGHVGAFALLDRNRVSMGLWRRRNWLAMSSQALRNDDGEGLAACLTQLLLRCEAPLPAGTLHIAGSRRPFQIPLPEGWTLRWLGTESE